MTVAAGATLTLEPGVAVRFAAGTSLAIDGVLSALGSEAAPIVFGSAAASPQAGDWYSVDVRAGGSARLAHCEIAHAGRDISAALRILSSDVTVRDTTLRDSQGDGAHLAGAGLHPTLERVSAQNNGGAAVRQSEAGMAPVYKDLSCTGNGADGVVIASGWMTRDGVLDGAAMGAPFVADLAVLVPEGVTLTVTAGTSVLFRQGGRLGVSGTLSAEGTAAAPIAFGSAAASPQAGDWYSVYVDAGGSARLAHCEIAHAGRDRSAALRISSSDVTVRDTTLRDSQGDGAYLAGAGLRPTLERVSAQNNAGAAIWQSEAGMAPVYQDLSCSGNGADGVVIASGWMTRDGVLDGAAMGAPFIADLAVLVPEGVTLTVTAGTSLLFRQGGRLGVSGTLNAEGTAAAPIAFGSAAASPQAGDWYSVYVDAGGSARLAHCEIAHAGRDINAALRISSSDVTVRDTTLRDSQGDGAYLAGAGLRPTLERVSAQNNGGAAVRQGEPGMSPVYRSLTFSGNSPDAIAIEPGTMRSSATWDASAAGAELRLLGRVLVPVGQLLSLVAGTTIRCAAGAGVHVDGAMYALGSADKPVVLTGVGEAPGGWVGVGLGPGGAMILDHCELAGGGQDGGPMLSLGAAAIVRNCRILDSAGDGIATTGARQVISGNQISGNAFGLRNATPDTVVDARHNWWGHASGPAHPSNPFGQGDRVSDGVLFEPWLQAPGEWQTPPAEIVLSLGGPSRVSPGQTVEYAAFFLSQLQATIDDVVLVVALPGLASFVDATGGGIYWPELHQVFWRLGDLAPGATATVAARVRFPWGLPDGLADNALALLGSASMAGGDFDFGPYLTYQPTTITSESALDAAALAGERAAHPDLDRLLADAAAAGFTLLSASALVASDAHEVTSVALGRPGALQIVERDGDATLARTHTATSFELRDVGGGLRFDYATGSSSASGSWAASAGARALAHPPPEPELTVGDCMRNILVSTLAPHSGKRLVQESLQALDRPACMACWLIGDLETCSTCAAAAFPGSSLNPKIFAERFLIYYGTCLKDPNSRPCKQPERACTATPVPGGDVQVIEYPCVDGVYGVSRPVSTCAPQAKCTVGGKFGAECTPCPASGARRLPGAALLAARAQSCTADGACGCSAAETTVQQARDPNEKAGPEGDVLPGQLLEYTVACENVGQGQAFGVYIVDRLSPYLDETTLAVGGNGIFLPGTRDILWDIGELAAAGEAGSKGEVSFSVRARPGLPSGIVIANQAVVYFPSVPEETPTNTVVNVVQPLTAAPQRLTTTYGQPVSFTLTGQEASGLPLSYTITATPVGGELTGTPPQLTYTPAANFNGLDTLLFTVSNGVSESRPATVEIAVASSPADTTPPAVSWTYPEDGAAVSELGVTPIAGGAGGPSYVPALLVQMSEALDPATVGAATVTVRDASGGAVAASASFDAGANQVAVVLHERWRTTTYTVTLGTGIRDLAGNALAPQYVFSFEARPTFPLRHRLYSFP